MIPHLLGSRSPAWPASSTSRLAPSDSPRPVRLASPRPTRLASPRPA